MASKEEYEARKAKRQEQRAAREVLDEETLMVDFIDTMDRLATAFERIADAVERKDTPSHG